MKYKFTPRDGIVLTPYSAHKIISEDVEKIPINFSNDYTCITRSENEDEILIKIRDKAISLKKSLLKKGLKSEKLIFVSYDGDVYFLELRSSKYYKLRYLGEKIAPTLEINGIHMHNISSTNPLQDASRKIKILNVKARDYVLDICTGLGYTAIASLHKEAQVKTIEKDVNVLILAEHNPFSRRLSDVEILLGDAYETVNTFDSNEFDKVLHDPPTFALAGELYSREFYFSLYRIIKRNGLLFHYTGSPGKHRNVDFQRGVCNRLRSVGFKILSIIKGYGVLATKY